MAPQADIEKDPFLVLLTDALRAGPGSPEWRDAVAQLKTAGDSRDEYRLLIEARESLESGKDYRSVRAGAGFTRKLLGKIESEPATASRPFPLATTIAGLAGLVIIAAIGIAIYQLYPRGPVNSPNAKAIDELANTYFANDLLTTDFVANIPLAWRTIGSLPVEASDGLHAGQATAPPGGYVGGGVVISDPIAANQAFALHAVLQLKARGDNLIPQVFIANGPDFSSDRATGAQELVWQLSGGEQQVVVGGKVENKSAVPAHTDTIDVRIVLNHELAIVEAGNHRLWAGPNGLGDQPRYVGLRFIRTPGKSPGDVSFKSVRIQKN